MTVRAGSDGGRVTGMGRFTRLPMVMRWIVAYLALVTTAQAGRFIVLPAWQWANTHPLRDATVAVLDIALRIGVGAFLVAIVFSALAPRNLRR
jgi:hypothetical protein